MKYFWDSKDLRRDLRTLTKLFEREKDPKRKEQLSLYLAHVKTMIINEELPSHMDNENYLEQLSIVIPAFEIYYPYIKEFRNKLSGFISSVYCAKDTDETERKLSNDDIIELVNEMYKTTNKEIYEVFSKMYKRKNKCIKFEPRDYCSGSMIFMPGLNNSYLTVEESTNYRSSLITAVHEFAHGIIASMNPERYVSDDYFFTEIETHFFELIANDFFSRELNDDGFNSDERDRLESNCFLASDILEYKKLIDYRFMMGNPDEEAFCQLLSKDLVPLIVAPPDYPIEIDINTVISYIVAIELYEVYRQDKDLAFEMLDSIVRPKGIDSEYASIVNTVTPVKTLSKFRNRIYSQTKKDYN